MVVGGKLTAFVKMRHRRELAFGLQREDAPPPMSDND